MLKTNLPKQYWDSLKSKEELYDKFDRMPDAEKVQYEIDPDGESFFKDDEFKETGKKLETIGEAYHPVGQDVATHFTTAPDLCRVEAEKIINDLDLTIDDNIATMAYLIDMAFDTSNERSFINLVAAGNGIPEARAACRAFKRYKEFRQQDDKLMEEFMRTPEYKMQAAEVKLGLRDSIEVI